MTSGGHLRRGAGIGAKVGQITPDAVEGAHAKRGVGIVANAAANRGGIGVVQPPGLQVSEHRQRHRDRIRPLASSFTVAPEPVTARGQSREWR